MKFQIWKQLQQEFVIWRVGALPGLMVIGLIVFLRLIGLLQPLEWWTLDYFLRLRSSEPTDDHILIVGIDEKDIQTIDTYPIPDAQLADLIERLQASQPAAIGLDLIRDLPVGTGGMQLNRVFQTYKNIIGIEKALPDASNKTVQPPPALPPDQVGFADLIFDPDGALRRALIGTPTEAGYKFSLPLLLAERYLANAGFIMDGGVQDPEAIRFGKTEFDRFRANSGGYVQADDRGNQILINYRSGKVPFQVVSLMDVTQGKVPADLIRGHIVLIGMTATSVGDLQRTNAVDHSNVGSIRGVEAHAHITSQMISAVLQGRAWLNAWADGWEYVWIIGWGILGISLGRFLVVPWKILLGLGLASLLLVSVSYGALLVGWWLAVVPALLVLVLNSAGLAASQFYRYQQELQARLQARQQVIERTYTAIHNIPVQTLKSILSNVRQSDYAPQQFRADLERLEQELRAIEESVRQETLIQNDYLELYDGTKLDLQYPLHQLLHEVYRATLMRTRDFPRFASVTKIVSFETIENRSLTIQQKQGLCRFMEEALCNTGIYAEGMTRLEVSCKTVKGWNVICVADNGIGIRAASSRGYGTQQAVNLARQLGGKFRRFANSPKGTVCELIYPVRSFRIWSLRGR